MLCLKYSTWEPEDNILDPRLVLAYEEKEEKDRALAYKRKGLRPRRVILRNIYPMDLRSAHKVPDKPSPRIRLSLTRSMGTELDQNGRRCREGFRRIEKRKNRHCRSKLMDDIKLSQQPTRLLLPAKDSAEKEWNGDEEDEQKKKVKKMRINEENTTEVHPDIPSGDEMSEVFNSLTEQDSVITIKDNCSSIFDHAEKPNEDTLQVFGATENQGPISDTQKNEPVTNTAGGEDSVRVSHDTTNTDQSLHNSTKSGIEKCVFDNVQNRPSVIEVHLSARCEQTEVRETGEADRSEAKENERIDDDITAECTTTLQVPVDQSQTSSVTTVYPEKVVVTQVTINSLTVTFKEAMTAEGFFSSYELEV
ncbi:chromobox homolog 7a isoform X2 [Pseudorasbora parva]|uniref:chromobox homolog 7a isoform X2 n=1 Tax=Pseudorasbora parva TaxID=51549 RepID=UPI00351EAB06